MLLFIAYNGEAIAALVSLERLATYGSRFLRYRRPPEGGHAKQSFQSLGENWG